MSADPARHISEDAVYERCERCGRGTEVCHLADLTLCADCVAVAGGSCAGCGHDRTE